MASSRADFAGRVPAPHLGILRKTTAPQSGDDSQGRLGERRRAARLTTVNHHLVAFSAPTARSASPRLRCCKAPAPIHTLGACKFPVIGYGRSPPFAFEGGALLTMRRLSLANLRSCVGERCPEPQWPGRRDQIRQPWALPTTNSATRRRSLARSLSRDLFRPIFAPSVVPHCLSGALRPISDRHPSDGVLWRLG